MPVNLRPYMDQLRAAETELKTRLASGSASASSVAISRRAAQLMEECIRVSPASLAAYEGPARRRAAGATGPEQWRLDSIQAARDELYPHQASDAASEAYLRLRLEYVELGRQLVASPDMRHRSVVDDRTGRSYLMRENPEVPRIMRIIADELMLWFESRRIDRAFLRMSARAGLATFLRERQDMVALLRMAQTLPLDTEISEGPVRRPASVEAVELAIGLIPVVGNLVAAYEAYEGVDLFGYRLTDTERAVLAATVLLPLAGRLVKGGRLLYSEARLVALYGRDAAAWSRTIQAGSRVSAAGRAMRTIDEAEAALRTQRSVARPLAQRVATALPQVVSQAAPALSALDQAVLNLFNRLRASNPVLNSLDAQAFQRILERGPNVDHLKGQLLEELLESRLVPWLRDRAGSFALGIQTGARQLEFIPGHLVRDASGRQITDGLLAIRQDGVLEIMAVFEAKAGSSAARELSVARGSISSLSAAERTELRAYARDVWRELREAAEEAGTPFSRTIADVEREIILTERGGQVRRDIERLAANADGSLPELRIGSDAMRARLSPTRTKFFGVLPSDVNRSLIERELRDAGFSYEIIGVDATQRQLRSIAADMTELAATLANAGS